MDDLGEDTKETVEALQAQIEDLNARVNLLIRTVGTAGPTTVETSSRVRVPDPRPYGGARDAKELDNFLPY